ncbi:LytTR family DNA-binding domain-containing protein [Microbulbifer aggregans]|uniref:LytTR family DNA-binding domain-containing protein n=1 Tax=Microbulbifer aggregans TaxID=1769779 RepID=UPI001CFCFF43|nr:LytTR family DNA-binding domain-containing protein [Microbulbifer aggregans]
MANFLAWQYWSSPYARSAVVWFAFFLLYNFYCFFWRHYIGGVQYDFVDSQTFWVKEWGTVLLLSFAGLALVERIPANHLISLSVIGFGAVCLVSSTSRVLIDYEFYGGNWGGSLVGLAPKYLMASVLVVAGWWACLLQLPQGIGPEAESGSSQGDTLQVEHLGVPKSLPLDHIQYIAAAGNYVEIHDKFHSYIQRGTIKQFADILPDTRFMRVHRSYIINLAKVTQLSNAENGAANVLLGGEHKVAVSKTYKNALKNRLAHHV